MLYRTKENKFTNKNYVQNMSNNTFILQLPFSADKVPQLVAYGTPRSQRCVSVDGSGQVCTIVHCKRRRQSEAV